MRIFVTGSTGFIGSHFVSAALAAGHEVVGLRYPGTKPVIPIPESERLTWIDGDLNSFLLGADEQKEDGNSQIEDPRGEGDGSSKTEDGLSLSPNSHLQSSNFCGKAALVHLAAAGVNPKHAGWDLCFDVNVHQSLQLWRRAAAAGVRRFVICGSCFEYGLSAERYDFIPVTAPLEPTGAYHASKAAATMAAIALGVEEGLEMTILRPFHVFGEGEGPDRLWPSLRRAALAGDDFPMSPGGQIRDFVPVGQVAQAFLRALELPSNSSSDLPSSFSLRVANVGTGRPQTILEFANHWWNKWKAKGKLIPGALPYRDNEVMRYVPEVEYMRKSISAILSTDKSEVANS